MSNPSHTFLFRCISYKTVFMTQQLTTGSLELMVWWSFLSSDLEVDSVAGQSPAAPAGAWQHIFATGGRATVVGHHSEGAVSQQHYVWFCHLDFFTLATPGKRVFAAKSTSVAWWPVAPPEDGAVEKALSKKHLATDSSSAVPMSQQRK